MNNPVLASTGTIVGRINDFDPFVFINNAPKIAADGFEFMMEQKYVGCEEEIAKTVLDNDPPRVVTFHTLKDIGHYLSSPDTTPEGLYVFERCCYLANALGAHLVVLHLWSGPSSDADIEKNMSAVPALMRIAEKYRVTLAVENVPCSRGEPFSYICELNRRYPELHYVVDTRFLALHAQFDDFLSWDKMYDGTVAHLHISEFGGTYRDFKALRPILHPGEGKTDFDSFFATVIPRFDGTINLESPVHALPEPDIAKLNRSLDYIRAQVQKHTK